MTAERAPFRLNFWMTVCAIPALMLLVGLGVWQLQRLEWKEAIIAERAERRAAAPIALAEVADENWKDLEHRRVTLRGRFLHDREMLVWNKVRHGQTGFDLITPLRLENGGTVLVQRGWVPRAWPTGVVHMAATRSRTSIWNTPLRGSVSR
ncbi:MAG: SURF1 family protein [Alphaproteobacteria bacterium]|nr:SURF1 family protein [Alphaproteobacteria bacterium]